MVIDLIGHLLNTKHSIDSIDSIIQRLQISKDRLFELINNNLYKDYFQILHLSNSDGQTSNKLALTLDLFCCTHYGVECRNEACSFLHLCPYHIRPQYKKCTNITCPLTHRLLDDPHNRKIINIRNLSSIPESVLFKVVRASADPNRSLWVCNDFGRKGCQDKSCDKLHYCYYYLSDACTKPRCAHAITDACIAYFRKREIHDCNPDDIFDAFRKVLRQRKPDFVQKLGGSSHSASKIVTTDDHQQKRSNDRKNPIQKPLSRELSSYDEILSTEPTTPPLLPETERDIHLISLKIETIQDTQHFICNELGCPIKLLMSKNIFSEYKEKLCSNIRSKPIYYYCPIEYPADIFSLLRWQNASKHTSEPLTVYASLLDAHHVARQNFDNNQFCILRVHVFKADSIHGTLLAENRLQLTDPSTMCFDRMWIYVYNFQDDISH